MRFLLRGFIFLTIVLMYGIGGACCTPDTIDIHSVNVVLMVNGDGTITAIYSAQYGGEENGTGWSWLLPTPGEMIEVRQTPSLNRFINATERRFIEPLGLCAELYPPSAIGSGGGSPDISTPLASHDSVENPAEWLQERELFTETTETLIENSYADHQFVALNFANNSGSGFIEPVAITYQADDVTLPLRWLRQTLRWGYRLNVWILGETQYTPETHPLIEVDFSGFRNLSRIGSYLVNSPNTVYSSEISRMSAEYDGLMTILEAALPMSEIEPREDVFMAEAARFDYLTLLHLSIEADDELADDPRFVAAPNLPDLSHVVDLNEHIDPLEYWGCSTRTLYREDVEAQLPSGSTQLGDLHIRHPETWVLSAVEYNGNTGQLYALAPEPVDQGLVLAALDGRYEHPMFVFHLRAQTGSSGGWDFWGTGLGDEDRRSFRLSIPQLISRFETHGTAYALLTNPDDYAEHQTMYDAMFTYIGTRQFQRSALRHTLYFGNFSGNLNSGPDIAPIVISYPEGWRERWDRETQQVHIDAEDGSGGTIRFVRLSASGYGVIDLLPEIAETYQLDLSVLDAARDARPGCNFLMEAMEYTRDGRHGFMNVVGNYGIEVSVEAAAFDDTADMLRNIANSGIYPFDGCG
jgi:hypothetical protein